MTPEMRLESFETFEKLAQINKTLGVFLLIIFCKKMITNDNPLSATLQPQPTANTIFFADGSFDKYRIFL